MIEPETRVEWSIRYVRLGWPVLPLRPATKIPLVGNGSKDATLNEDQASEWFTKWPDANIGITTGDRFFVLDVDIKAGGEETFDSLARQHGSFPGTLQQITGTGGKHLLFLMPDFPVHNSQGLLGPGLDIRGRGGYIVAAPSIHPEARRPYFWDGLQEIEQQPILAAPEFLLSWLRKRLDQRDEGPQVSASPIGAKLPKGQRHNALLSVAGSLRRQGLTADEIFPVLAKINRDRCEPPYNEAHIRKMADSVMQYPPDTRSNVFQGAVASNKHLLDTSFACPAPVVFDSPSEAEIPERKCGAPAVEAGLPDIIVGGRDLRHEADEALIAIRGANNPPRVFVQSGHFSEIVVNEKGRWVSRMVDDPGMRGLLTRKANFRKKTSKGLIPCYPPKELAADLLALPPGSLGLPVLDGVVGTPIIHDDGQILADAGYDPASRLYYSPPAGFCLPELASSPSSDHVEIAKGLLLDEMLGEFPFCGDADKAAVLGALLTGVMRSQIAGPVPLHMITAPGAGTGKTLLSEIVATVLTGEPGEMLGMPAEEEEMAKLLSTVISDQVVVFDNVCQLVKSGELAQANTASQRAFRIFRTHEKAVANVRALILITGNNLRAGGDIPRRCIWIRLDAKMSRPFLRNGFRIPDLKAWLLLKRPEILAALLTLARAWYVAGKPRAKRAPLGSFESWSLTIGGILEHVGVEGFLDNMQAAYEESDEALQWEQFLLCLADIFGERCFGIYNIYEKLREPELTGAGLRSALPDYLGEVAGRTDGFFQRRAAKLFAQFADRRFGKTEVFLRRAGISHHAQMWEVRGGELGELVLTTTVRAHMRAHVCAHVELKGSDSPNSPDSPF